MGLLNSKSSTSLYFHVSKSNEISYYYFGHLVRCYLTDGTLDYLGIDEKDKEYPVDLLINTDLSKIIGYDARNIRNILHKSNLLNEYDRQYLNSINFKESDLNINVLNMNIPPEGRFNINNILLREGYYYLFQLILANKDALLSSSQIGPKRLNDIEETLNTYGYPLRTEEVIEKEEDEEELDPIRFEDNGEKVVMSRKTYTALCKEIKGLNLAVEYLNCLFTTMFEEQNNQTRNMPKNKK